MTALRYSIDASQAQAGAKQFVAAVKTIRTETSKNVKATSEDFERLKTVMMGMDFGKFAKDMRALSSVNFKASGIARFSRDVQGLSKFKGPSRTEVNKVRDMAKAVRELDKTGGSKGAKVLRDLAKAATTLNGIGKAAAHVDTLKKAVRGLANVKASGFRKVVIFFNQLGKLNLKLDVGKLHSLALAMKNLRPPTNNQVQRFQTFLNIMATARVPKGIASGLMRIATSFAAFKPPTKSQTQRFIDFIRAMNGMKFTGDVAKMVTALDRVTASASRAGRAFGRFRKNITNLPTRNATRGINGMSHSLRGLENAFSLSFHAGSLFRVLIGGLSMGTFARDVFNTSVMLLKADAAFRVARGSAAGAVDEMGQAIDMIERTGGAIDTSLPRYAKFIAAASQAGMTVDEARAIFENTAGALTVFGANAEDSELAFLAIEQIISKGVLSSEELRRQLAERLPGAFQAMAKALYPTVVATEGMEAAQAKLNKELKLGTIESGEAMKRFSQVLKETYGPELENALKRPDIAFNRLKNQWTFFKQTVADNGFMTALGEQFDALAKAMMTPEFNQLAVDLSQGLARAITKTGDAMLWVIENADKVKEGIKAVVIGALAFKGVQLATSFAQGAAGLGSMVTGLFAAESGLLAAANGAKVLRIALISTGIGAVVVALGSLAAYLYMNRDSMVQIGDSTARLGTIFGVVFGDIIRVGQNAWTMFTDLVDVALRLSPTFQLAKRIIFPILDQLGLKGEGIGSMLWKAFKAPINSIIRGFIQIGAIIDAVSSYAGNRLGGISKGLDALKRGDLVEAAAQASGLNAGKEFVSGIKDALDANDTDFVGDYAKSVGRRSNFEELKETGARAAGEFWDGFNQRLAAADADNGAISRFAKRLGFDNLAFQKINKDKKNGVAGRNLLGDDYDSSGKGNAEKAAAKAAQAEAKARKALKDAYLGEVMAVAEYTAAQARLKAMLEDGQITGDEHELMLMRLKRATLEARDPMAALNRDLDESIALTKASIGQSDAQIRYMQERNQLIADGTMKQGEENAELREKIRLEESLKNFTSLEGSLDPLGAARQQNALDQRSIQDAGLTPERTKELLDALSVRDQDALDPRNAVEGFKDLADTLSPVAAATAAYNRELDVLNRAREKGLVIAGGYAAAEAALKRQYRDQLDPLAAITREMKDRVNAQKMTTRQGRIFGEVQEHLNDLAEKGVVLTAAQTKELTNMVAQLDRLENPEGFQKWIDSVGTLRDEMSKLATTIGDELSASFAKLFTTGEFPIEDFLTSIRDQAAQSAGDLATKTLLSEAGLGDKGGLIGGAMEGFKSLFNGKEGDFMSSYMGGYNQEKTPTGLEPGDTVINNTLLEILAAIRGEGFGAGNIFDNDGGLGGAGITSQLGLGEGGLGGIMDGIKGIAGSFFDGEQGNSIGGFFSDMFSKGKDGMGGIMSSVMSMFGGESGGLGGLANAVMSMFGMGSGGGLGGGIVPDGMMGGAGDAGVGLGQSVGSMGGAAVGAMFGLPPQIGSAIGGLLGGIFDSGGEEEDQGGAVKAGFAMTGDPVVDSINMQTQVIMQVRDMMAAQAQQDAQGGDMIASGGLLSLFGGVGMGVDSLFSIAADLFSEGGYSTQAVASGMVPIGKFRGAPKYANGTANTSSGGRPAILHDNEAVIPLSGGRAVPVQMRGESGGGSTQNVSVNFNIRADDPNAFGRSEAQIAARARRSIQSAARNA